MEKSLIILAVLIQLLTPFHSAEAQYSEQFKLHLRNEKQYRELGFVLSKESEQNLYAKKELASVLVLQELLDSAYIVARSVPAANCDSTDASLIGALGIIYHDSALAVQSSMLLDTCDSIDIRASWNFVHNSTAGLRFCDVILGSEYQRYLTYKHRKPAVAGILSTAVPGLGKIYSGQKQQFWPVFITNLVLAAAAAESARSGFTSPRFIITTSVFSVFYGGNIWGAIRLAQKSNHNAKNTCTDYIYHHYRTQLGN